MQYSNENQLLHVNAWFCLTIELYKYYPTSAQMGIPCIKSVPEEI